MNKRNEALLAVLGFAFLSIMGSIIMIEWISGCGETYIDANGIRHQYQCVFVKQ